MKRGTTMVPLALGLLLFLQVATPAVGQKTVIYAELRNELSSKFAHVGQRVEMVALGDVKAEDGTVVIPQDAKLTGKVTAVQKHRKNLPATLTFSLDRATWKGGSLEFRAQVDKLELMKNETLSASGPSLNRSLGNEWGGNEAKRPAADCSVQEAATQDESNSIVCRERDIDMGPGGRIFLIMISVPKG